ncbi:MAG TPA: phosphoenolpyruvate--protein phosphotransferase [Steroidobacteraceae bacterium]|nr:phosphoenolpyruvate--protein phosphotransferase [Steroidobacteraceae bacterium]
MSTPSLLLTAPLPGWSTPLEEAPDEVFATRMLGDGVAIDPTGDTLCAPCDGELLTVAAARHAVTLRAAGGCELLLHVGIDTVALNGAGFTAHVAAGARVRTGQPLLSFDLDLIARRAKSALTPVVITGGDFRIIRASLNRALAAGEFLMELAPQAQAAAVATPAGAEPPRIRRVRIGLEHGIHARPAALAAAALRNLAVDARLALRGREANARSTVALMALGVQHGDEVELRASGPDALAALDALGALLARSAAGAPARRASPARPAAVPAEETDGAWRGVTASPGLAVGRALQLARPQIAVPEQGAGPQAEHAALDRARAAVRATLERRAAAAAAGAAGRDIAVAHLELLDDPELLAAAREGIAQGRSAGFAWRAALRASAAALEALPDARLRERADDLLDLETQVLLVLQGRAAGALPPLPPDAILIARELLPSQLAELAGARPAGICMAGGGPTSHAAILAAAMGIPALVALGARLLSLADGTTLVLDADHGTLEVAPAAGRLDAVRAALSARAARRAALTAAAQQPGRTADGTRIEVFANVGSVAEAEAAVVNGAEGCGLLRTEFLFLEREQAPTEEEQRAAYQRIADALGARPLVIRTLDAGGDKPIAYLPLPPEDNPALGLRGVRTGFAYPQLLRTQLAAVLGVRSAARCRVLLPMITDVEEVQRVRALLEELCAERGVAMPALGAMIETPAAALLAARLAAVADFLSIGTNDLTQYTLAMDRGHPQLAPRLDALHPAVLRLIADTAQAAKAHERHTAVCGGLASDAQAAPLLVGLGVTELSAVPAVIPQLKAALAGVTVEQCRALAADALAAEDAAAVRALLPPVAEAQ